MNFPKEIEEKVQELQVIEQNLQSFLMQKQTFQIELNEISNALEELKTAGDEVYRILGGIMLKSDKKKLSLELEEKKKVLNLRISSIEKQEKLIETRANKLKEDINSSMKAESPSKKWVF